VILHIIANSDSCFEDEYEQIREGFFQYPIQACPSRASKAGWLN